MQCPACSTNCAETARICPQCHAPLSPGCVRCGAQLIPAARFCHHCGSAVSPDGLRLDPADPDGEGPGVTWIGGAEGEKRLGTILFADMTDSVELTRHLHPEDGLTLVKKLLRLMAEAILAHGGQVDRFLGDGALGVFGVTQTQESDPERAILAALRIRSAARELGINVTVGINTGDVYAGGVGSEEYQEQTVMGPVVNLASRLQTQAAAGEILVGEATYRVACRAFRFTPRSIQVKGMPQPLVAYAVEGPLVRPTSRPLGSRPAELVGRSSELTALLQAADAARSGQGQVVTLVGEPGVGKSRLVAELRQALKPELDAGTLAWLDGRCLEYCETVGYWPFVDAIHQWLNWHAEERDSARRSLIVRRVAELGEAGLLGDEQRQLLLSVLSTLLSVRTLSRGDAPHGQVSRLPRHLTFHTLRRLFTALAQQRPLVLALDDVHWADSLSMDFLAFFLDRIPEAPILLICAHRPVEGHPCQEFSRLAARKCRSNYLELRPSELTGAESTRMAASLLGTDTLSGQIRDLIRHQCHGNPLFIEELIRSMVDSGFLYATSEGWQVLETPDASPLPTSIQSVILSRVDRLPPVQKQLLQHASVLGTLFRPKLLEHLGQEPTQLYNDLRQLTEAGLVVRQREAPEEEYAFKHALTRETIYDTILRRTRKALHAAVAEALEQVYRGHLEEHYAELGRHFALAERHPQAATYFILAGERGKRLFANREAKRHFEQALRSLEQLSPSETRRNRLAEALEGLGDVCFRLGAHHEAEGHFRRARDIRTPDRHAESFATLSWKLADAIHWQGDMRRAIQVAQEGLAIAGEAPHSPSTVRLLEVIMRSHWAVYELDSARARGNELERALPHVPYFESLYMIYYALAWLEIKWKQFDRAREWLGQMQRTCEEHGDEIGLSRCFHGFGDLARAAGEFAEAAEWFARSVVLCERVGDAHLLMEGYLEWAQVLIMLGRPEAEAEPYLQKGMALAEEMAASGNVSSIQLQCSALGRAFTLRGNVRRAIYFHQRGFDFGPHPAAQRDLAALRALFEQEGRLSEFLEFCARVGEEPPAHAESL